MCSFIYRSIFGIALFATGFVVAPASANDLSMPTAGRTSQPVGHYEFCKRFSNTCQANPVIEIVDLTDETWETIVQINSAVNANIRPRTDQEIFGIPEYWTYPTVEGDCEDFALLKQYMLARDGVPTSALLITVLRQTNGAGHAVLTVRTDKGDYILDNLDERILKWMETDYTYLKRQSEADAGKWMAINDDRDIFVGSVRK